MKTFSILLLLILAITVKGQGVTVYGNVTCTDKNVQIESLIGVRFNYTTADNAYYTVEGVDKNGFYNREFENANEIVVGTNYHDFYANDIIIKPGGRDSVRVDLKLIPKPYVYTRQQALSDTRSGKIQLITFDTLEYNWTRKINLKRDFGFEYLLLKEPTDDDFRDKMEEYNAIVKAYLRFKNPEWEINIKRVKDSVINYDADEYGRKNKIDLNKLKIPEINSLPKGMQKQLATFQDHYERWYKDRLKDYTFDYVISIISTDKDYNHFELLPERISIEYEKLLPELIKLLTDNREIGLTGFNGIMFCRGEVPEEGQIQTGILIPYSEDDLYTVAGRANHLLKIITDEDFGDVLPNPDEAYLRKLQNRWAYWALQLQKE